MHHGIRDWYIDSDIFIDVCSPDRVLAVVMLTFLSCRSADNNEWAAELPKTLWKKIVDEIQEYYDYKLEW